MGGPGAGSALLHWGRAVEQATGRSVADQPGAGAAGGTTAALLGFTNAVIRPGVEVVAELVGLADLLSRRGPRHHRRRARPTSRRCPARRPWAWRPWRAATARRSSSCAAASGPGAAALDASGAFAVVQPIADRPMRLAASMRDTERLLANAAERVAHTVQVGLLLAEPSA